MSCTSVFAKDFMKRDKNEKENMIDDDHDHDTKENLINSSSEELETDHQTLDLFRKNLFTKDPQEVGKSTNEEESPEAIKRAPPQRSRTPHQFYGGVRGPSFLELALLPGIRSDPTPSGDKSSTSQLTIFYAGEVNVYDDVPLHKAQAIILLAGETSLSAPIENIPKTEDKIPLVHRPILPSVCKLQADLPIARKYSLQRFLEKRGRRKINKSPYASSEAKQDENDEPNIATDDHHHELNEKGSFTPSPFPSRLGYCFTTK